MKTTLLFLSVFLSATLFGQNVYIPDANFKSYLIGNSVINTNGDTEIQVSEASAFSGAIFCASLNISDLTGIEAFTSLTELNCQGNQIESLDLSNSTALETIYCGLNQLTSLDLSSNTSLTFLDCFGNQLTSLDVSNNTSLGLMGCGSNQLASLDVSNNTVLAALVCENNQLECLNFKNGNNTLLVTFLASGNPNLTCIQVDDVNYSTTNWTSIDPQTYYGEDCDDDCDDPTLGINELTTTKSLIQILDMMGRETSFKPNTPLIYVYDDGSIEKVFSVEY